MNSSSFHRRKAMADTVKLRRTRKIALLLTILCASALYGMKRPAGEYYVEPDIGSELKPEIWGHLPDDVKALIMVALAQSGNNLDEAIDNIKKVSVLNKALNQIINAAYGNLQGFTQLVHILADKFVVTTKEVAEKFGTAVAKRYIELGDDLFYVLWARAENNKLEELINTGVDVNYSFPAISFDGKSIITTPMFFAMRSERLEAVRLLINFGAKLESDEYYDTHDYWPLNVAARGRIKQFIDEERVKRQKKE